MVLECHSDEGRITSRISLFSLFVYSLYVILILRNDTIAIIASPVRFDFSSHISEQCTWCYFLSFRRRRNHIIFTKTMIQKLKI